MSENYYFFGGDKVNRNDQVEAMAKAIYVKSQLNIAQCRRCANAALNALAECGPSDEQVKALEDSEKQGECIKCGDCEDDASMQGPCRGNLIKAMQALKEDTNE
jgi:hypothetical protein